MSEAQIASVVALMKSEGLQATVSSIHINGWYGNHNKLAGARWIVRELLDRDHQVDSYQISGEVDSNSV